MPRRAVLSVVVLCLVEVGLPSARAAAAPPPTYVPPVDAAVVDPFRPPPGPFRAGNRGLEYGTVPGTPVGAAADGTVVFAGPVAGALHVTVRHDDGVRTSYSFLARIDVVVGQRLRQGDVVGTTIGHLHLGARVGDAYIDPATLFEGQVVVHLVPFDEPPGTGPAGERSAIAQLIGGLGGLAERAADEVLSGTGATVDWLRAEGGQVLRTAAHYLGRASPGGAPLQLLLTGFDVWGRASAAAGRSCTPSEVVVAAPTERRLALLVGGLGSTSDSAAIDDVDVPALGYEAGDVLRFSYAGGRTPDPTDAIAVAASPYEAHHTQLDLRAAGVRLADLVEDVATAEPDTPIDLLAHSQGGLVARLALLELQRRHGRGWVERLGLVATLGTPHGGADLATAVYAVGSTAAGSAVLDGVASVGGLELDDDAPSVSQLAETSSLVRELADAPLPEGLPALSLAARGDLVVPVPRTAVKGAPQVVLPLSGLRAHDALPGSPAATRELQLLLAGRPPTCTTLRSALADQVSGAAISWAEDAVGAVSWVGALRHGPPLGG